MRQSYAHGFHVITKLLQHSPHLCRELVCVEDGNNRVRQLISLAKQKSIPIRFETWALIDKLADGAKHRGCVISLDDSETSALTLPQIIRTAHARSLILVLDGVQDPHNFGACLRSADSVGVDAVIIPKDRSVKLTATVRKVAAGGAESVAVIEVNNIARCLDELKKAGFWIYGTSGDAEHTLYDFEYNSPVVLVMGAEGSGIRRLTATHCDQLMKIPMHGAVESLNVSVATGVCLYEILRARMACG